VKEGGVGNAAVCPGSFDPLTNGHLDVIRRAGAVFDRLVVAVLDNPAKTSTFDADVRVALIEAEVAGLDNVEVERFSGLLVDYCAERQIMTVVKGLRGVSDFESELQMAQINRRVGGVETVFLPAGAEYAYLSSTLIKQLAQGGAPLAGVVPDGVETALRARFTR
jgi:pantetheine-phosphate adenylyltransferase